MTQSIVFIPSAASPSSSVWEPVVSAHLTIHLQLSTSASSLSHKPVANAHSLAGNSVTFHLFLLQQWSSTHQRCEVCTEVRGRRLIHPALVFWVHLSVSQPLCASVPTCSKFPLSPYPADCSFPRPAFKSFDLHGAVKFCSINKIR